MPAPLVIACLALAAAHLTFFPLAWLNGWWIREASGLGHLVDFVTLWSAGHLAAAGQAALAYDWDFLKSVQVATLGQGYDGHFGWHYPPPFLFIAALIAQPPYDTAFVGWVIVSFIPFAIMVRALTGRPFGWLLALAFPVLFNNVLIGSAGFFTATLVGATLYLLPKRPVLAGICLGFLSYKPQYGVLFPIALIAAREWRAFVAAGVTTIAVALASLAVFGLESWQAFFHWLPMTSQAFLGEGRAQWGKMQSVFALVRLFGGSEHLAWVFQWVLDGAIVVAIAMLWRSRVRYTLKAAALVAGAVLVTPYIFLYDDMMLVVAVALLIRLGVAHGFRPYDAPALGLALLLLASYAFLGVPTGFAAALVLGTLIAARCRRHCERSEAIQTQLSATGLLRRFGASQ